MKSPCSKLVLLLATSIPISNLAFAKNAKELQDDKENILRLEYNIEKDFKRFELEFKSKKAQELVSEIKNAWELLTQNRDSLFEAVYSEKGLKTLSINSQLDKLKGVDLPVFVANVSAFDRIYKEVELKSSRVLQLVAAIDENAERVNLVRERIEGYLNEIKEEILNIRNEVSALVFRVQLKDSKIVEQIGIDIEGILSKITYSPEDLDKLRFKEKQLRAEKTIEKRVVDNYSFFIMQKINAMVQSFGKDERYFQSHPDLLDENLQELSEAFWTRSYLRATFGMKLGSFGVQFKKPSFFSFERFFSTSKVGLLETSFIRNENELLSMQKTALDAMNILDNRNLKLADCNFFSFVNGSILPAAISFVKGDRPLDFIQSQVLKLILADLEEEKMLSKKAGLKGQRGIYRARYYSNKSNELLYKELEKIYLYDEKSEGTEKDIEADVDVLEEGVLKTHFSLVVDALEKREDRLEEADGIKILIESSTKDNAAKIVRKKRYNI